MSTGELRASPAKGQATELLAQQVTVHGWADSETYPLQKKGHTYEFLRTIAHLRPRTNTFGAVARLRNRVSNSIHQFFQELEFLYVHTPIITASDCEGPANCSRSRRCTSTNWPRAVRRSITAKTFFGKPAYLTVSGQLNGET